VINRDTYVGYFVHIAHHRVNGKRSLLCAAVTSVVPTWQQHVRPHACAQRRKLCWFQLVVIPQAVHILLQCGMLAY